MLMEAQFPVLQAGLGVCGLPPPTSNLLPLSEEIKGTVLYLVGN